MDIMEEKLIQLKKLLRSDKFIYYISLSYYKFIKWQYYITQDWIQY